MSYVSVLIDLASVFEELPQASIVLSGISVILQVASVNQNNLFFGQFWAINLVPVSTQCWFILAQFFRTTCYLGAA